VENIAEERCDVVILPPVADEPRNTIGLIFNSSEERVLLTM